MMKSRRDEECRKKKERKGRKKARNGTAERQNKALKVKVSLTHKATVCDDNQG